MADSPKPTDDSSTWRMPVRTLCAVDVRAWPRAVRQGLGLRASPSGRLDARGQRIDEGFGPQALRRALTDFIQPRWIWGRHRAASKANGSHAASRWAQRVSHQGRVPPTANAGYQVAQLGGQLSGGEIARPGVAGGSGCDGRPIEFFAGKPALKARSPQAAARRRVVSTFSGASHSPFHGGGSAGHERTQRQINSSNLAAHQ
jgi:hypothetical protein